jgi:glyoxylase-like metal-dependent hydrolase (beta-lactamase superfamily II)
LVVSLGSIGAVRQLRAGGQSPPPPTADEQKYRPGRPNLDALGIEVLPVQGSVYLIATGAGPNLVVQVGDQGAFVVDAGTANVSARVLTEIKKLTKGPVRAIVDTTTDADHIGGNETLAVGGAPLFNIPVVVGAPPQAQVFAHEKAVSQISAPTGQASRVPSNLWPSDTFVGDKKKLFFNHEPIELLYAPGHTDGDIIVWFRRSDVIAAGELFSTTSFPRFDRARGGSLQGVLDGLNHLVDLAVTEFNQQGGTRIVPSHGRIGNQSDVVEYRDMATIVRDRVRAAMTAGKTLDQIKASSVTLDYDGLYATPLYTGEMFVEAVYNDLKLAPAPATRRAR